MVARLLIDGLVFDNFDNDADSKDHKLKNQLDIENIDDENTEDN